MFEKEADLYASIMAWDEDVDTWETIAERSFQKGAEFGYKKANEWHFVKDEFPPENVPLNIITLDKNKKRRLWVGEYKGGNGEYWSGYFNHFIDVPYAWKEIVLPKEIE